MCLPNHGSGHCELITVLHLVGRARKSKQGFRSGKPEPYLSAIATTTMGYYVLMPSYKVKIEIVESIIELFLVFIPGLCFS